ncbi:vacuolar protein sorting-associated protein, putative [Ricinus communis]|uniref:Vacuolar protein sorting-associated protein, putative n=1 Tax=Ricinus communis TaxID=3988 RepID=B9RUS0_RICCO|nr:vacuolar protein sorting-associated protein, putative [Ricinus communis]
MLEDQVAYLLQRYLGNYVRGLNKEALKISVWQGDVELTNMQLKPEALNALQLPVKVKAGFLGSVKLKVPWSRLGQDPVLVYLDRIFLLAEPATEVEGHSEDAVQEAKKSRVREMEMKLLERAQRLKSEMNKSWLGSLINTIIGNLRLSISNIHIRYEDAESNPGHPFATGITLGKLSAITVDDNGMETFVTGGTLDRIQKSVELDQLALYLDSDISPWYVDKPWEDLLPSEWVQVFRFGTNNGKPANRIMKKHSYILQPVTGNAKYSKLRSNDSDNGGQPLQKAAVNLDDVTLCLSKDGYRDILKLADNFAAFNQRLKYAHYRPVVSVTSNPRSWWKYAFKAVSDQMKKARLRKKYISLYASLLKSDPSRAIIDDNNEIEELDCELDIELILQWRMLAHKFVERSIESELYSRKQKAQKSWWSFGWNSQSLKGESEEFHFNDEDWEQLNKLIGYRESDDEQSILFNQSMDALHTHLEVHMQHNASKLVDGSHESLAELSCDGLDCSIKLFPETKVFDMKLGSYRLSSPNGLLAESASALDSLTGVFCYKPFDAKVDWSMVVKASPCYMTYLKDSIDEIIKFFESNHAVSQTIALETAAAVQMTIDGVKRTAQQQVNRALKDQSRFLLDLDIAAPKITIPTEFRPNNIHSTKLMLDLGNLVIRSQDDYGSRASEELDLYLQFDLVLSDMCAFLVDGDYHWSQTSLHQSLESGRSSGISFLPVVDKCGVILRLQQIRLENPSYPSTRLSVRLPSLGFHFSPARYHRLMQVAKIFQDDDAENFNLIRPWDQADFEGWLYLLVRKGMGNREAVWQRRYLCLVGPFLYILENPGSKSYKQYLSLRGKQIYQVPEELVGGVQLVLSICDAGHQINKVVEDVNALILRCDSDDLLKNWQSRLQGAIYRASDSAPIISLSETSSDADDSEMELNDKLDASNISTMERVFLTGVLDELKICFNYSGRVQLSIRANDMFIGTVLKSLEIEDLVCARNISQPSFLARSFIRIEDGNSSLDDTQSSDNNNLTPSEGEDKFYEASENLVDPDLAFQNPLPFETALLKPPNFGRIAGLLPGDTVQNKMEDIELTNDLDSFVKAQIVIYDHNSSLYSNIDMQVSVTLATLSFYCRRPTILAIMKFVNTINLDDGNSGSLSDSNSATVVKHGNCTENVVGGQYLTTSEESVVKGLLGKGKSRIIFNLILNMARAQILLMNENETKLASLSQDNLLTDIKVFPSSFSIKAALGNLRISDESLPVNHAYFWICDMRDPGGSSFVELVFTSFSVDDEDYEGYEYSLFGQLSEVRIVYLNRFVQEVVSYFMGLAPNNSKGVVKLKDQITNSEKSFTTSEIEGSPALKLNLSLRKPIILMPRRTDSPDYLKLDVVHITVQNTFHWFCGGKNEVNAVHLETLTIQVEDINLNVGSGTELGESIIKDVKGVSIGIQRSLRDLLHQVPSIEASIKIEELRAALSNREYQIVTECTLSNMSETPHAVPPVNHDSEASSADMIEPVDSQDAVSVESEAENGESWILMKVSVLISLVELSLHTGLARDASLATLQIAGAWLLYKSNNLGDGFLSATLKGFTVIDDREGTEEEFRLAIGKPENIGYGPLPSLTDYENPHLFNEHLKNDSKIEPTPTMLILDAKFGEHSTFISLCVQRPQLLVALDFLLPVVEFFVPTLGSTMSNEEDNPIHVVDAITLDNSIHRQTSAEISLSPLRPLIVDSERFNHFIYDGQGGILHLKDRQGHNLFAPSKEAIIYVGSGKKLQFKNVIIKNGKLLDSCISLGSNSSYLASRIDQVHLEEDDELSYLDSSGERKSDVHTENTAVDRSTEFIIEFQAIGPELTFYSTCQDVGMSPIISNKLLHAQLDAFARLVLKGDTMEMTANALGLMMESNGIRILEPFDTSVTFSNASGKTNIHLSVSNIFMNFTFSILRLFIAIEEDILAFLRMTSKQITVACSEFDKVGIIRNPCNDQIYAFWRPRAPPGFAVLGDYLTPLDKPPTKGVLAVNMNFARIKRPMSFKRIWPPLDSEEMSDQAVTSSSFLQNGPKLDVSCSLWFPEAPKGYVALGCVVSTGRTQPHLYPSTLAFWRVENSFGTFLPADPKTLSLIGGAYELRHIKYGLPEFSSRTSEISDLQTLSGDVDELQSKNSTSLNSGRHFEAVASFQLIWWNRASSSRKKLSIWRPVVAHGMVYFGDIAVKGYEPPNTCIVLHDTGDQDLFKAPLDYQLVGQIKKQRGMDSISFWMPQAPPGFVSLGCVACKGSPKLYDFSKLRCMRSDMVAGDQFLEESVWDTSEAKSTREQFSIWTAGNELGTFIVRSGFKRPPRRFALNLADPSLPSGSDDTVIDAEIGTFSTAIFDDYGGLMVPLFNISLSGIGFNLHGRTGYLNSTVSFSLAARSYNDKYESWEPLVEPVDGFVRYQYDLNAPGAASQLRLTSTRELNLNVTVSNANMIIQAYASWNNLSHVHEYYKNRDEFPSIYGARSVIDVHQKRNYFIVPQNKLGQDIFIRATEMLGRSNIIRMPSGDILPLKVPVSKNMLESHLKGKLCAKVRKMVTVIIVDAQFPRDGGLTSNFYTVAIRLTPNQVVGGESLYHQQSARTSGSISNSSSSELELVNWNEIFFFKVDCPDNYLLELIVTDMGKGGPVGFSSAPLNQIAVKIQDSFTQSDYLNYLTWIDLAPAKSRTANLGEEHSKASGRIRCSVFLSPGSEAEDRYEYFVGDRKPGFIQISPGMEGPWTTVRLNYAAPAACWRLGNDVVASEVSVKDGNRNVTIRSLVSVRNSTDFILDLHLVSKASSDASKSGELHSDGRTQTDEFFETEIYKPNAGWVGCSNLSDASGCHEAVFGVELPSGWEWIDDWHLDTSSVNTSEGWVHSPDAERLKWPESFDPMKFVNHARQRRWIRNRKQISGEVKQEISVGSVKPGDTLPLPLSGITQFGMYILQLRPSSHNTSDGHSWSSVVERPGQTVENGNSKGSGICISNLTEREELLCCTQISGTSSNCSHRTWFCVSIQATEIAKDMHSDPIQDWSLVVKSPLSLSNYLPLAAEYSVLEMQATGHFVACARGIFSPGKTLKIHTADIGKPLFLSLLPQRGWLPIQFLATSNIYIYIYIFFFFSKYRKLIVQLILEQNYDNERPLLTKIIRVYAPYWLSVARCPPLSYRLVDLARKKHARRIAPSFESKNSNEVILEEITEEEIFEGYTIASALNFNMLGLSVSIAQSGVDQHFGPVTDLSPLGDMDGSLDLYAHDADGNCIRLFVSAKPCPYQSVPTKVRLEDTEWSYPVQITKEDTIFLVLRRLNGTRNILRTEIRGYEEGSRFIVVFRLGSTDGPIRIENRIPSKMISIRQTGFGDGAWIILEPLSTTNFSWDDPYGQKFIDAKIDFDGSIGVWKFDLERPGISSIENEETGLQFHVVDLGDIKVARFRDNSSLTSHGESTSLRPSGYLENSRGHTERDNNITPIELIVELGVVGISVVDHRPKELSYLYLERVFISFSTGYDGGKTSRFKLILGYLQLDNQLPLTLMPVLLAPEQITDMHNPVFKMTITQHNENADGILVYPYVYVRVTEKVWRLNIHEPIIWSFVDFYNNLQLDRLPQSSSVTQVDPEIRVELIDVSEIRLKLSLETAPAQRPHGVLGVWSPVLSAVGNAFKIQVHLRRVMHADRFMRKSSIVPAIGNRIWRDLIHNPLHLLFSVDVLGMTSSTLASLSKGFAELSTDGQFLQLRSKQVRSRRITGVGDGIIQGTEALAQGVAFGFSGVVTKPVESARQNGLLGLAHGLGRAFLGFIVQPVSGALDFFSLTVDGIGASCSKCLEVLNNKSSSQRIRNPRAIHADCILREYSEREAVGQMTLYLAEASRRFGCTEIFKEPSKFACSDNFEEFFVVPYQRTVLISNKRVMLLQCPDLDKVDKKPSKIMWDVPWEELMALELAKAGCRQPSHLLLHLKNFKRSENFIRVIKCNVAEESEDSEPLAVRICFVVRRVWKEYQSDMKSIMLKVPSSQRHVYFSSSEADGGEPRIPSKAIIESRDLSSSSSTSAEEKFVKHGMNFLKIWSSERESKGRCKLCKNQVVEDDSICSIWRPICPNGYISIGDIAHVGSHPPNVAALYRKIDGLFALPMGYDLVWRNCSDDYKAPVSIWHPRAPEGFVSPGCVAVAGFEEPEPSLVRCVAESQVEQTEFEEQKIWSAPDSYPWACHIYQVKSDALHFAALRQVKEESNWKPVRVLDDSQPLLQSMEAQ